MILRRQFFTYRLFAQRAKPMSGSQRNDALGSLTEFLLARNLNFRLEDGAQENFQMRSMVRERIQPLSSSLRNFMSSRTTLRVFA